MAKEMSEEERTHNRIRNSILANLNSAEIVRLINSITDFLPISLIRQIHVVRDVARYRTQD